MGDEHFVTMRTSVGPTSIRTAGTAPIGPHQSCRLRQLKRRLDPANRLRFPMTVRRMRRSDG
jgi:hypothetical protein